MTDELIYLEIPRWDEFQHYQKRRPPWIKNYTRLLHNDAYLSLSGPQRAVLHGLWILYAACDQEVVVNTSKLSRKLQLRVTKRTLEALSHAGFIHFRASTMLDQRQRERQRKPLASETSVENPARIFQMHVLQGGNEEERESNLG